MTLSEYTRERNIILNSLMEIEVKILALESEKEEKKQNVDFAKMFIAALSNLKNAESKQEANKILKIIIKKIEIDENKEVFIHLNF